MQTRTHLTSPPGQEPTATSSSTDDEVYVAGLALPEEPPVPGRHRRPVLVGLSLVVLVLAAFLTLQVMTMGEDFDPALDQLIDRGGAGSGDAPAPDAELPDS